MATRSPERIVPISPEGMCSGVMGGVSTSWIWASSYGHIPGAGRAVV